MRLSEIIPNLDPNGVYVFNIMIDQSQGRHITATMDTATAVVMSPSLGGDGTQMQVQMASDKVLTVVYTGAGLLASAQNGKVELEITAHSDPEGENRSIVVTNIHIDELRENMNLPIAMRVGSGYRYGFNGMERDDEISGSGNSYTTTWRGYDSRLGRWKSRDPLAAEFPWQSSYVGMDNNPIWNTDRLGDSTSYFNAAGDLLHQSNDGLENAVVSIGDKQLGDFNNRIEWSKTQENFDINSDELNEGLRGFGTGYAIDDFKAFFNENKGDVWGNSDLINEHKTFLYMKDGLIRPGKENFQGDPWNVAGGSPLRSGAKGKLHTHPNAGKSAGFGQTFTHRPSKNDYNSSFERNSFHDVVVSDKYIFFINNRVSENMFAVPFRNTFGGGNAVEIYNPFGE